MRKGGVFCAVVLSGLQWKGAATWRGIGPLKNIFDDSALWNIARRQQGAEGCALDEIGRDAGRLAAVSGH